MQGKTHVISSLTNPKIKMIYSLNQRKFRKELNSFIAEGIRICKEALKNKWKVSYLLCDKDKINEKIISELILDVLHQGGDILEVTSDVLSKITKKNNPQNVIAVIKKKWGTLPDHTLESQIWVGLEQVRDPGNLGTILRTIDAVGGKGCILIDDCTDPFSYESVRASMGALFNLSIVSMSSKAFLKWIENSNTNLIGTSLKNAIDYKITRWNKPFVLLMGNEQEGLTDKMLEKCDQLIRIPMFGNSDSLNLAVSTGVILYE